MMFMILLGELFLLYVFSRSLIQALYNLTVLLFRARSMGVMVVTLLTFPGTVIHELSHLFTAEVLGVKTGKLTLVPENIRGDEIKAGSVMIASSDPFRRYAVGLAPIVWGMVAIVTIAYFIPLQENAWVLALLYYLLFAVSNSMFSSPEDLKGFIPFVITIGILVTAAYVGGLRVGLTGSVLSIILRIIDTLTRSLGLVLALNVIGLLVIHILIVLVGKITHRRILS